MKTFLHVLGVSVIILVASAIDSITDLIFSNPYSAFFGHVFIWFGMATLVAVFIYSVKQVLNFLEGDRD
jgi:hypothetical protein